MKLLFGTGNQAKLSAMRTRLECIGIELIGLSDLRAEGQNIPEVLENGKTPLDCLSKDMRTKKYYYDLSADELENFAVEDGVLEFF